MPRISLNNYKIIDGLACSKESACSAGDLALIPGLRTSPGEGNGYPLQNSKDGGDLRTVVHGAAKTQTQLSHFRFHVHF